jgi:hypothetical protein
VAERWIPDNILPWFYKHMESLNALERTLIRHGWMVKLVRSNITRGWTYNSDMFRIQPTGRYWDDEPRTEINRYIPHGAGHGATPALAVLDAARLTNVKHPEVLVAILECEVELLAMAYRDAVRREAEAAKLEEDMRALDWALIDLTDTLAMVKEPTVNAIPDEDDDL